MMSSGGACYTRAESNNPIIAKLVVKSNTVVVSIHRETMNEELAHQECGAEAASSCGNSPSYYLTQQGNRSLKVLDLA